MRLRRLFLFLILATVIAVVIRRLGQGQQARVDVYLADGSLTSLGEDVPEGSLLLSLAREVRAA